MHSIIEHMAFSSKLNCIPITLFLLFAGVSFAQSEETTRSPDVKFAFYSSAWTADSDDGMRLVLFNENNVAINLTAIVFQKTDQSSKTIKIELNKEIPPQGYATKELEYIDLLQGNDCIKRTLTDGWKLTEISNHTLNPSVRNLIIEDTDSFRIYQCIENVRIFWSDSVSNEQKESFEWAIFHFETI